MALVWEKVLYKKQYYPDNYVEASSFLKELRRNLHTPTYTKMELVNSSQFIVRPFTLVCLFMCCYSCTTSGWMSPLTLFSLNGAIFIFGFIITQGQKAWNEFLQPSIFLHLFLIGVAPILCTLTQSISSDTLWAMALGMLFFHLIFYSYKPEQASIYNATSLNAAIFAAVCLASLMNTALEGFALVSLSVHIFAFAPKLYKKFLCTNIVLVGCTTLVLSKISLAAAIAFSAIILSITTVFPLWLFTLQEHKNNIYGPWDEATLHFS